MSRPEAPAAEAERALLGALLLDGSAHARVDGIITTDDLSVAAHRHIYHAITAVARRQQPVDGITVTDELEHAGELDAAGGRDYLAALVAETPSAANVHGYAALVREHALRRTVADVGRRLGRSGGGTRTAAELAAAGARELEAVAAAAEPGRADRTPRTRRASAIEPRPLDPIWGGLLWAGKPTLVAGDPGLGKSMMTCDIAARVTTGAPWPCTTDRRDPADVVMMSAEDDAEDTIVPRLIAAGADLERLTVVDGVTEHADDGPPRAAWLSLDRDLEVLGDVLRDRRPRLVVIDPITAYMGRDTDTHRGSDVRLVLAGLAELARVHRCAVLAVTHLRKSDSTTAMYRVMGSLAFVAAARAVYCVVQDPDDDDARLLLPAKNNLAPDADGYAYRIGADDDGVPQIRWADDREPRSLADVTTSVGTETTTKVDAAAQWLRAELGDRGPIPSTTLHALAREAGHSRRSIERARRDAGDDIVVERGVVDGGGARGPWQWRLATPPPSRPPDPHTHGGGLGGGAGGRATVGSPAAPGSQAARPPRVGGGGHLGPCRRCAGEGCHWCEQ